MSERRQHPRYRIKERAFAIYWSSPTLVGPIVDISPNGISFSYIEDGTMVGLAEQLGILCTEGKFYLEKINFQRVSDVTLQGHPKSILKMRRMSGKFPTLSRSQQAELNHFIQLHTISPAL